MNAKGNPENILHIERATHDWLSASPRFATTVTAIAIRIIPFLLPVLSARIPTGSRIINPIIDGSPIGKAVTIQLGASSSTACNGIVGA